MKAVVEKVKNATLFSDGVKFSEIKEGYVILFGVHESDTIDKVPHFAQRLSRLRVFRDENDKMNLSIQDVKGEIMLVSNFTLYGDTSRNNRPSFSHAAPPELAEKIYLALAKELNQYAPTVTGVFRTHMDIQMTADGPGTFILDE